MSLVLIRHERETWLDAALRMAAPYGLMREVTEEYELLIEDGEDEDAAAWSACYEWDVLDLGP